MAMARLRRSLALLTLLGLLLMSTQATAEQWVEVGDYEIHYSAIATRHLSSEVAQAHRIQRSAGHGLVNVAVRQRQPDGTTRPVMANVQGSVGGLNDAGESLGFRNVRDGDATYHIALFTLRHDEPMRFDLEVRHDRNAPPQPVSFIQRFYIER
ncbi:DUF4426 domain-containing protein [Halomonas sp. C22]|uniref:DUF4426 domain-containing protein n=1 Tax=Halomonas sp. C22 TaxID=2580567 RepID=UPI0011A294A4|nr:DUF4426 domain-containing protein [Halomonas sp. C22]